MDRFQRFAWHRLINDDIQRYVRRLAPRRVLVPRIVRLTGRLMLAVEAILRGAHMAAPRSSQSDRRPV